MIRRIQIYIPLLGLLLLLGSCKPTGVITSSNNLKPRSAKEIIKKVNERLPEIKWLDGRALVSIQIEGNNQKFSSQIRVKKDSLFLANGKKISVEGGRIQISRDSFYLLNRAHKTYEIKAYDHVTEAYAVPLGFDQLMNMLLAQPIFPLDQDRYASTIKEGFYSLKGKEGQLSLEYTISGKTYDIVGMTIKDSATRQSCTVRLDEYKDYGHHRLSGLRTFTFDNGAGQLINMKVDFSKIQLNAPKTFKFSIPSGFIRLD
jgi:hypothetical protein